MLQWVLLKSPERGRGTPTCVAGFTLSPRSWGPKLRAFQEELFSLFATGTVTEEEQTFLSRMTRTS